MCGGKSILFSRCFALVASVIAFASAADEISESQAMNAARGWRSRGGMFGARIGTVVERTRRHTLPSGETFYDVKFKGGGTVFTAGDSEFDPIIAFTSATNDFSVIESGSPLHALLTADMAMRRKLKTMRNGFKNSRTKWSGLLTRAAGLTNAMPLKATSVNIKDAANVGDLRVAALVRSKWDQGDAGGGHCYNYYTPSNYVCGCVATAMSQLMRYHEWPQNSVSQITRTCYVDPAYSGGVKSGEVQLTSIGGTYDWSNMSLTSSDIKDETNREAIGHLTYDAGVSVYMGYTKDGSGAFMFNVVPALKNAFGYSSAYLYASSQVTDESGVVEKAILSNLDAGYPVLLGISGNGGHAIVADGYGYNDELLYVHLNMGWAGSDDYWYNLPNIGTGYSFNTVSSIVFNVFPHETSSGAILSGRITDQYGNAVSNMVVSICRSGTTTLCTNVTTSSSGVYSAILAAGTYDVSVSEEVLGATKKFSLSGVTLKANSAATRNQGGYITEDKMWTQTYYNIPYIEQGEGTLGNSWGNDLTVEVLDPDKEYVKLVISSDAPASTMAYDGEFVPAAGTYYCEKGTNITISAPSYAIVSNQSGTIVSAHALSGTNSIELVLNEDYAKDWSYPADATYYSLWLGARCEYTGKRVGRMSTYDLYPWYGGYYLYNEVYDDEPLWITAGSEVEMLIPDDMYGGETFSISKAYYRKAIRVTEISTNITFKLGAVMMGETNGDLDYLKNDKGISMPTNKVFVMDGPKDVLAVYWNETYTTNNMTIPYWYYMRELAFSDDGSGAYTSDAGDPDGDGFTNLMEYGDGSAPADDDSFEFEIKDFSITNLTFVGSIKGKMSVQGVKKLGDDWTDVWQSLSRTSVSNRIDLSGISLQSNTFFRVHYEK